MPNKEVEFYRQTLAEPIKAIEDLVAMYTTAPADGKPLLKKDVPQYKPSREYKDYQTGEMVSGDQLAQRDAIRRHKANQFVSRGVYGRSPQYTALPDQDGPFGYMGNMSPYHAPPTTYGQTFSPQQKVERVGAEVVDAVPGAVERAAGGALGAVTGGIAGDAAVRNIKEFVSIGGVPAIKRQTAHFWEPNDRWGREYLRNSTYMPYEALGIEPEPYVDTDAIGSRYRLKPDGSLEYVPGFEPRLSSQHEWYQMPIDSHKRQYIEQPTNLPPEMYTTDNPDLMPEWLQSRSDVVARKALPRHYKRFIEEGATPRRYTTYQVAPLEELLYKYLPPGDYQVQEVGPERGVSGGEFPDAPEGVTKERFKFPGPKQGVDIDRMGKVRGGAAGLAAEAMVPLAHEVTQVPAAYVKDEVAKLGAGDYAADETDVAPESKTSLYTEAIQMLNYGLPDGYFGSERHKREEALSRKMGQPLTEQVKIARQMMKYATQLQTQDTVQGAAPDAMGKFKDFGFSAAETALAGTVAGLL